MKEVRKITIWNGCDSRNLEIESRIDSLARSFELRGVDVRIFDLDRLELRSCKGCWDCWVKTPGECSIADDTAALRIETIHSDLLLMVSDLDLGFISWPLKRALERMIPLLSPYIDIVDGEAHHFPRYDKRPDISLLLNLSDPVDPIDLDLLAENFQRVALNFQTNFVGIHQLNEKIEEVSHALACA